MQETWGNDFESVLNDSYDRFKICKLSAKMPVPLVRMPLADTLKEKVAMDLKYIKGYKIYIFKD